MLDPHPESQCQLPCDGTWNILKLLSLQGQWGSYRHLALAAPTASDDAAAPLLHSYANVQCIGDLASIVWLRGPLHHRMAPAASAADDTGVGGDRRLVAVHFAAINFRDVMLATGRLAVDVFEAPRCAADAAADCGHLGLEYAGHLLADGADGGGGGGQRGPQRVMGIVAAGAIATLLRPFAPLTWPVPAAWTLRQAATVPVVYVTVYYAFFGGGGGGAAVSAGKSILIHAGSGGVGLAAIRVALAYGLEVFATVSTEEKKRYLLGLFGQLKGE